MPVFAQSVAFCLATNHDLWLVVLAVLVAILASFTALHVAQRVSESKGWSRLAWLAAAAFAIGGGIWSMHFIAMLAFALPVHVGYDLPTTLLSLAIAVLVAGFGLTLNARPGAGPASLIGGGLVMGLGVAAMHYSGMAAMRMPARIVYEPWLFALSIAVAMAAATAALYLAFRTRGLLLTLVGAAVMGLAISGTHFTGMAAASFVPVATQAPIDQLATPRTGLAVLIAVGTAVILAVELVWVVVDRRFNALSRREALMLKRSEERLRALIENASDLIFLVRPSGRIGYAAAGRLASGGRRLEGREFLSLFEGEERIAMAEALEKLSQAAGSQISGSCRLADAQGQRRDFDFVGNDLRDHPAIEGFVFTLHDVTERARAERATAEARLVSEQASRAKSQFITTMSHELRTPLNAVIGFSEIIAGEVFGPLGNERYRDYANDIRRSGQHLLSVVNDILDIGKIEAGEITLREEEVTITELVERATSMMAPEAAERRISIVHELPTTPMLSGDGAKLARVLINLLSNAIKFSPDGGRVVVSARAEPGKPVTLTVADRGIGIGPADLKRIWQPFVQADGSLARRYQGSGLGLPIARGLAELHGGRLELESSPGEGTTARLTLPVERLCEPDEQRAAAV